VTKLNKHRWQEKDYITGYLEARDVVVVERERILKIWKSFYSYFLKGNKSNKVLELGCGDGALTYELLGCDNNISAVLVDGSEEMLKKAREQLASFKNVEFLKQSFSDLISKQVKLPQFSFIFSSLAIHHLELKQKKALFKWVFEHLKAGGRFVNIDLVRSPSKELEDWYIELWKEWIVEKQALLNSVQDFLDRVKTYSAKDHYAKLSTLSQQLHILKRAGFSEVDVFYQYGVFSMYGGKKVV